MERLRDQRDVEIDEETGIDPTPLQLRAAWRRIMHRVLVLHGGRFPRSSRYELETRGLPVEAYVNDNRWIADCPDCGAGIMTWPAHEKAVCLDCGSIWEVNFPGPVVRAAAERLLLFRPPENRFWAPGRQTVAQLRQENLAYGFPVN